MEGIKTVLLFCLGFGTITLCIILIISGVLQWLSPSSENSDEERKKRFNILSWIAFAVLAVLAFLYCARHSIWLIGGDTDSAPYVLNATSGLITYLLAGVIVASVVTLILIIFLCLYHSFQIIIKKQSSEFLKKLNTRAVALIATCGLLSLFLVLPMLAGFSTNGDLAEMWINGLNKIASLFGAEANAAAGLSLDALISYVLLYIIILGVGFAVFRILHSVIAHSLNRKPNLDLIHTYSAPIALLAVGVAFLWTLKKGASLDISKLGRREVTLELLKSFVAVVVIMTIVILTLEIIRLLMDMREPFIRSEARYLFVSVVGHCTILIAGVLTSFCGALNSAIGNLDNAAIDDFEAKMKEKMVAAMNKQLEPKPPEDVHPDRENGFAPFDEQTTKKGQK